MRVLILAEAARAAEWSDWLRSLDAEVFRGLDQTPPNGRIDVILTDRFIAEDIMRSSHPGLARGDAAVIAIGEGGPADVALPADATPREVTLACRLLADTIDLRRRLRISGRRRRTLAYLASTDHLTQLPNRRSWDAELRQPRKPAKGRRLGVAMFDLVDFKRVNDEIGHATGDQVLQAIAKGLSANTDAFFVARIGGDEFGMLFQAADEPAAHAIVERTRARMAESLKAQNLPPVRTSAGYALADPDQETALERLWSQAEAALRAAKHAGGDCTRRADAEQTAE